MGDSTAATTGSDDVRLDGRVAAVTGAGAGLGRAHAHALAAAGARVVVNDVPGGAAGEVAAEIRDAGGQAVASEGDVRAWETGAALVAAAVDTYGALDILVNNAGLTRDRMIFNMSEDDWDLVVDVHLKGHFIASRHACAYWRERSKAAGGPVYARIVNTASEAFLLGSPGQPNYAAAKGGIAALTTSTAHACARYGVRANAICPRARTAMTAETFDPAPEGAPDPLSPDRVTPLVTYLCSPAAAHITAQVFVAYGSMIARLAPPTIAKEYTTPTAQWTPEAIAKSLGPDIPATDPGFITTSLLNLNP
ncbi:MAG TPA: SDR family NAD(P)-dependent oxidoreductase [Streptosporangiaceae bacterium]